MSTQIDRRGLLKTAAWMTPAIYFSAAAPAYATSVNPTPTPTPQPCVKAKVKTVKFSSAYDRKKKRYTHTVNVTLSQGLLTEVAVLVDGTPASINSKKVFVTPPISSSGKLVQIKSCGQIIWSGRPGHEC